MSENQKDVLEKLAGWGYTALKESVEAGQKAMKSGVWSLHIAAAKGEDANRIHSAYSALLANAPTLFAIVDALAEEVRQLRDKTRVVEEIGGVKVYASGRIIREANERIEKMQRDLDTQKALAAAWKRDCEAERAKVEQIGRRLDAIKKAVGDE